METQRQRQRQRERERETDRQRERDRQKERVNEEDSDRERGRETIMLKEEAEGKTKKDGQTKRRKKERERLLLFRFPLFPPTREHHHVLEVAGDLVTTSQVEHEGERVDVACSADEDGDLSRKVKDTKHTGLTLILSERTTLTC